MLDTQAAGPNAINQLVQDIANDIIFPASNIADSSAATNDVPEQHNLQQSAQPPFTPPPASSDLGGSFAANHNSPEQSPPQQSAQPIFTPPPAACSSPDHTMPPFTPPPASDLGGSCAANEDHHHKQQQQEEPNAEPKQPHQSDKNSTNTLLQMLTRTLRPSLFHEGPILLMNGKTIPK